MSTIDPKVARLVNKVLQICIENGYIGFAGTFRDKDGFETFHLEAPGFADGACSILKDAIDTEMQAQGLNQTRIFKGLIHPPTGSDEMPH